MRMNPARRRPRCARASASGAAAGWLGLAVAAGFAAAPAAGAAALTAASPADPSLAHARRLLAATILIDGHNDLAEQISAATSGSNDLERIDLKGRTPFQTDIPRLRAGLLGAQFWSVYVPGLRNPRPAVQQLEQIDLMRRVIARYPDTFEFATTAAEVRAAHRHGRIASLLGAEGGHVIENSLAVLRQYYALGVRYLTLTHYGHTDWADSATQLPARHHGLSAFGREVVREMNRLGMIIDLSHTSAETMAAALEVSAAPVLFTHSSARGLVDHPRNVPDDILQRLAANGGVVMVTFVPEFVDARRARVELPILMTTAAAVHAARTDAEEAKARADGAAARAAAYADGALPRATVAEVADHIEYVRRVAGLEHVGIGGDFDGSETMPQGLEDVSMYPNLFAELIRRGWSDADLRKLAGENVLRVMEQVERTARRLQAERPASSARIGSQDAP
jgi:membrane dipeptidase